VYDVANPYNNNMLMVINVS